MTSPLHTLYRAAIEADDRFHDELVRQFGEDRAGDMRYCTDLHDAQTRKAGERMREATDEYRAAAEQHGGEWGF